MHNDSCPFCHAPSLTVDAGTGKRRCLYCLETFETCSGELARGYELLSAGVFDEAAAYFNQHLKVPEAWYGLFLAEKHIEERVIDGTVDHVVYSYQPVPFDTDASYRKAAEKNAADPSVLRRLQAAERARKDTTGVGECDAIVVGKSRLAEASAAALQKAGYRAARAAGPEQVRIGLLRAARILMIVPASEAEIDALREAGTVARFFMLKSKAAVDNKRAYLLRDDSLPERACKGLDDCMVREVRAGTDAAHVLDGLTLPRPGEKTVAVTGATAALRVATDKRAFRFAAVAPVENQAADLERLTGYLRASDFSDAERLIGKLSRRGCRDAGFLWSKLLFTCRLPSADRLIAAAETAVDSGKLDRQALTSILSACASEDEAARCVRTMVACACRCLDLGRLDAAGVYIDTAASVRASDAFAGELIAKLQAVSHARAAEFDRFARLYLRVCDTMRLADGPFQYEARLWLIGCALRMRQFPQAEALADRLIGLGGATAETVRYKLFACNGCASFDELIKPGVVLGETFVRCVAAQSDADAALKLIERCFEGFCARAEAGEAWAFPLLSELAALRPEGRGLTADALLRAGDAALAYGAFEPAEDFFSAAIELDRACYRAYWGLLKALLRCRDGSALADCPTPIAEVGGLFQTAYNLAAEAGDTVFKERLLSVSARQSKVVRKGDHVFHREDHTIRDGKLTGYTGRGTAKVFLSDVDTVASGAYAGSDVSSLILDAGVKVLEDEAFCGTSLGYIALPCALEAVGVNPFAGCRGLTVEVYAAGTQRNIEYEQGVLYFGDTAVAALGEAPVLRPGTVRIGPKCFASTTARRIDLPDSVAAVSPCAFADSLLETVTGLRPSTCETDPNTFETALAGRTLPDTRLTASTDRWSGRYGGPDNNLTGPAGQAAPGRRVLYRTGEPINSGLLVRDGVAIFSTGRQLNFLPLVDAFEGNATLGRIELDGTAAGTGVLAGDDLVVPVGDSCTLEVVSCGAVTRRIPLGRRLTQPLTAAGRTVYAVLTNEIAAVSLAGGTRRVTLPDPVSGVPTVIEPEGRRLLVFPAGRYLYALDGETLETAGRFELAGMEYASKQEYLLCRGLAVGYKGSAYWFERHASSTVLGIYDGTAVCYKAVPPRFYPNTQPILAFGKLYAMVHGGIVTAEVRPTDRDWLFTYAGDLPAGAVNIAVVGDRVAVNVPVSANEAFRAIWGGAVLTVSAREGVIAAVAPE